MQTQGTKTEDYHTELRQLATKRKFANPVEEIKIPVKNGREKDFTELIDPINFMQHARTLEITHENGKLLAADKSRVKYILHQINI